MVLIIEGLDGVGKSTICQLLKEKLDCDIIHEGYPGEIKGERQNRYFRLLKNTYGDGTVIYDRCTCIDDFVYKFLNKQKSELYYDKKIIRGLLTSPKCVIFHLQLADKQLHLDRFTQRGDKYITGNLFDRLEKEYKKFYKGLQVNYIDLNIDNNKNVNKILQIWKEKIK